MRISLTGSLFVALCFIRPVNMLSPALTEDYEGSGIDLEASGSGDLPDQVSPGEINKSKEPQNSKNNPLENGGSGYVVVAKSRSILETKEVFAGIVAGGVIGVTAAAALGAVLIYKWQKKDGGYIMGQQSASDDYH